MRGLEILGRVGVRETGETFILRVFVVAATELRARRRLLLVIAAEHEREVFAYDFDRRRAVAAASGDVAEKDECRALRARIGDARFERRDVAVDARHESEWG